MRVRQGANLVPRDAEPPELGRRLHHGLQEPPCPLPREATVHDCQRAEATGRYLDGFGESSYALLTDRVPREVQVHYGVCIRRPHRLHDLGCHRRVQRAAWEMHLQQTASPQSRKEHLRPLAQFLPVAHEAAEAEAELKPHGHGNEERWVLFQRLEARDVELQEGYLPVVFLADPDVMVDVQAKVGTDGVEARQEATVARKHGFEELYREVLRHRALQRLAQVRQAQLPQRPGKLLYLPLCHGQHERDVPSVGTPIVDGADAWEAVSELQLHLIQRFLFRQRAGRRNDACQVEDVVHLLDERELFVQNQDETGRQHHAARILVS
mmetsp:Transcript_95190/g.278287  ORF Transcript_95190/g.278287 Transcript_95190/m.278287 type:complete len:324 (-) Transcript_95190:430-1401(-)